MAAKQKEGWIEVITGPMFAGKTEELLRRIKRLEYAKKNIILFKPSIDNRYAEDNVISHNKNKARSINISESSDILKYVNKSTDVVAIDEVQFLDEAVIAVIDFLAENGIRVMVSGLDMDFRGEPFSMMPTLLSMAEKVDKLTAVCLICGEPATRTQRIIDGKPARYYDPIVLIGAEENYEARCRKCHKVYRKPNPMKENVLN